MQSKSKFVSLLVIFIVSLSASVSAQEKSVYALVQESAVPKAVVSAHAKGYPTGKVLRWEMGGAKRHFVAVFNQDKARFRARYNAEGLALTETAVMLPGQLPEAVRAFAKSKYPDFNLMRGSKVKAVANGKEVYRLALRKGATRLIAFTDASGGQIEQKDVPMDIVEDAVASDIEE